MVEIKTLEDVRLEVERLLSASMPEMMRGTVEYRLLVLDLCQLALVYADSFYRGVGVKKVGL